MKRFAILFLLALASVGHTQTTTRVVGVTPTPYTPWNNNLVACYPLDSDYTDSVGGHTLTPISASPPLVAGKIGNAAQFTLAAADAIQTADTVAQMEGSGPFTAVYWLRPQVNQSGTDIAFLARGNTTAATADWRTQGSSTRVSIQDFQSNGSAIQGPFTCTVTLTPGSWYLVMHRYNADQTTDVKVRGAGTCNVTSIAVVRNPVGKFTIGAADTIQTGGDYDIDEVRLYNVAITNAQFDGGTDDLLNGGLGRACP